MTTPNTKFNLTVRDIEMIEHALRDRQRTVIEYKLTATDIENQQLADQEIKEIQDLLGCLHDQKIWYRPKTQTYISG
jgi:hypothetical protein